MPDQVRRREGRLSSEERHGPARREGRDDRGRGIHDGHYFALHEGDGARRAQAGTAAGILVHGPFGEERSHAETVRADPERRRERGARADLRRERHTGKNLVAQAIHALSRRKDGPFVAMNCGSLNDYLLESELFGHKKGSFTGAVNDRMGRFEAAHDGNIFLDEIGDMPKIMQVKLLRVLEEKVVERVGDHQPVPVNIRLISATNRDLNALVNSDLFREDLLYRINSILIKVPPLRDRVEDIPVITFHYLKKISHINSKNIRRISPEAMDIITNYRWPGNVRQLINALEHCAITCTGDTVEVTDLPDYVFSERKATGNEQNVARQKLLSALALNNGNRTLTAKHLRISRVTLWKRLKEFGIE